MMLKMMKLKGMIFWYCIIVCGLLLPTPRIVLAYCLSPHFLVRTASRYNNPTKFSDSTIVSATTKTATPSSSSSSSFSSTQSNNDNLSRGDAKGAALWIQDVSVSRGPSQILKNMNWRIEPKAKWALVGANGCGKSTLLKAIMEDITYDGKITVGTKQQVGYLQQTAVSGSTKTIYDEAASAMVEIETARIKLQEIQELVASQDDPSEKDLKALDRATERYEAVGGYRQEQEVTTMLKGLGFSNLTQTCDELSGGWQMRVSFARLLLSKPSLCLLDEPGNHLDRPARKWLAKYLANYQDGAMILVTHDKELLESMDHIAEITSGSLGVYKSCTYSQYLRQKEQRALAAQSEYQRNVDKAAKLQAFVDKWGASATKASAAQSRVKQIEKMRQEGLLDAPPEAVMKQRFKPTLNLPDPPRSIGETLLALMDATVGYTEPLVSNVNLEIKRGMKLLIRGPNGAGKSTILHSLRGTLPLLDGQRQTNELLRLGVFTQDLAQELDITARAVDLVTAYAREGLHGDVTISDQDARTVMGGLGLQGDKPLRQIQALSGGEKARVALAMFALKPSNVYLLDEVSNHLDVECVEALGESLSKWGEEDGAIVVISHDKAFCEQIDFTHVATVKNGELTIQQRSACASDWDSSEATTQPTLSSSSSSSITTNDIDGNVGVNGSTKSFPIELDDKLRKKAYNAPKRIAKLEEIVMEKEEQIAQIEADMMENGSDVGMLVDLTKEKEKLECQVAELMDEWEELETLLAQASCLEK